jgi:hypothetical protein
MMYRPYALACLLVATLLAACAAPSGLPGNLNDPNLSLVFGHFDMKDAPAGVSSATLVLENAPAAQALKAGVEDGLFYFGVTQPGTYHLISLNGKTEYNFQPGVYQVRVTRPGVYFLGSYIYRNVKNRYFGGNNFTMEKMNKPSEADLLRRVLENGNIRDSKLGERIRARLAQLR